MSDEPAKAAERAAQKPGATSEPDTATAPATPGSSMPEESARERDRGLSDLFRRAVSVGLEAAGRSKDDFVRIASTEIRGWLDHLELDTELRKALSKMVLEVKAEVRFRPTDDGRLTPEATTDVNVRPTGKTDREET